MSSKLLTTADLPILNQRLLALINARLVPGTRVTIDRDNTAEPGKELVSVINGPAYQAESGEVWVPTRNGTIALDKITNLGLELDFTFRFDALPPEPIKLPFVINGVVSERLHSGPAHRAALLTVFNREGVGFPYKLVIPASAHEWHVLDLAGRRGVLTVDLDAPAKPEALAEDKHEPVSNPGGES